MNSGLYALAGASATATAAACANRLDWPMTKLSKVYFGFSRVSLREMEDAGSPASCNGGRAIGAAGAAMDCTGMGAVRWASASSGFTTTRKVLALVWDS